MIGFHEDWGLRAINISSIRKIGPVLRDVQGSRRQVFITGENDPRLMGELEVEQIMKRPMQLLPAEPGAKLIWIGVEDGEPWVSRTALIAWALCLDGNIRPVTPAGVDDGGSEPTTWGWIVGLCDGRFYEMGGDASTFDDEDALKVEALRREKWRVDMEGGEA